MLGKKKPVTKKLNSVQFHFYRVLGNIKLNCLGKHTQVGKL